MSTFTFTLGVDSITIDGRQWPVHDPVRVNVVVAYSEGRQLYAYDKGITEQYFRLDIPTIPQAQYDDFEDWLQNIAVGPKNTFTFTDEDSTNHTVRLMDVENPLREIDPGQYAGLITLRKEIT